MIDPMLSLAMSMHANPGIYALLLGSGVSRSAEIPTGWEVVLDLIRRLAALEKEDCEPSPEVWYKNKYDIEPTYSGLLDAVAKSQVDRSQLLRGYFEPSKNDDEGAKVPTAAHHAIAQLVKSGHVRVILTTNFDRLMEQALTAVGVNPTVISSPDAVKGAMPITHSECTVVKLHGDYLDIRSKNTPDELGKYDKKIDGLLDRILDEFGLVVCGWSAEWDTALRSAIERCKSRRFTTYWATKGEPSDVAKKLIQLRLAETVSIEGADQFFPELAEKIDALGSFDRPHPISAKIAVAQTKKYLVDPKYRIQLHDLLTAEVERIVQETGEEQYPVSGSFQNSDVVTRLEDSEAISEIAASIMSVGCYWGNREHRPLWIKVVDRLANPPCPKRYDGGMQRLRTYPSLLLLYAGGIAAVSAGHYETLYDLFNTPKVREYNRSEDLVRGLLDAIQLDTFKLMPGLADKKVPRSERLFKVLRAPLGEVLPDDEAYQRAFDRFEALQSFWSADTTSWTVPGAFMYRHGNCAEGSVLTEIINERDDAGDAWPLFEIGFFSGEPERWTKALSDVMERTRNVWNRR